MNDTAQHSAVLTSLGCKATAIHAGISIINIEHSNLGIQLRSHINHIISEELHAVPTTLDEYDARQGTSPQQPIAIHPGLFAKIHAVMCRQTCDDECSVTYSNETSNLAECYMSIHSNYPSLACSLDGKVIAGSDVGLLEIKCPYKAAKDGLSPVQAATNMGTSIFLPSKSMQPSAAWPSVLCLYACSINQSC